MVHSVISICKNAKSWKSCKHTLIALIAFPSFTTPPYPPQHCFGQLLDRRLKYYSAKETERISQKRGPPHSFPVAAEKDLKRAHCIKGSPNFFVGSDPIFLRPSQHTPLHNDVISPQSFIAFK